MKESSIARKNALKNEYKFNYEKHLIPVPKRHAMLHRKVDGKYLSFDELKVILNEN